MPAAPKKTSKPKKQVKKVSKSVVKQTEEVKPVVVQDSLGTANVSPNEMTGILVQDNNQISNYADEFTHLLGQLRTLQTTLRELTVYTQKLEKRVAKDQKVVQKRVNGKRRRNSSSDAKSGFAKPGPISDELRTFLNLGKDELIARTDVTKRINAYCKENGLQDQKDKRILKADKTLMKLLRLKKGDELTFFNLQKYMKVHFPNKDGVYPTA